LLAGQTGGGAAGALRAWFCGFLLLGHAGSAGVLRRGLFGH
jgi:hypothetical protein